jgi:hypothetical protein
LIAPDPRPVSRRSETQIIPIGNVIVKLDDMPHFLTRARASAKFHADSYPPLHVDLLLATT